MAGRRGAGAARGTAGLRPGLLPVPGQRAASTGDVNPDYGQTFVFTNDFAALRPGHVRRDRASDGLFRAEGDARHLPGRVLLAAPRPDPRRDGDGRRSGAIVDVWADADDRARRALPLGPGVREPRRGDGRLEPAPARPDLGRRRAARSRPTREDARSRPRTSRRPAGRCCSTTPRQERGGPRVVARRRRLAGRGAVLGRLAVRDAAHPARPAPRASRTSTTPARDGLAAALQDLHPALRRAVRPAVPVLDGLAPGAVRRRVDRAVAGPRALLSAAAARERAQVHGRLRAARRAAARPHARGGRRAALPRRARGD